MRTKNIVCGIVGWLFRHKVAASIITISIVAAASLEIPVQIAKRSAVVAFSQSRGNAEWSFDSQQFISHGIESGMTLDQVNRLMEGATRMGPLHTNFVPCDFCYDFKISYGKPIPFNFGDSDFYIIEDFGVFFNASGRVIGVRRMLYRHDINELFVQYVDYLAGGRVTMGS
jgi:hypothetical protein